MNKFKVGDIVIGNSSSAYRITSKGVRCRVIDVHQYAGHMIVMLCDNRISGKFPVETRYFDLVESHNPDASECEFLDRIQKNMRGW